MAKPEHLEILKQGVEIWNAWRNATDIEPDLSECDLTGMDLSGAQLWKTNLAHAILVDVNFWQANLGRANLHRAAFSRTNLSGSILLRETRLTGLDLTGVNLEGMDLTATDLSQSCLRKSDLSKTTLLYARLRGTCLREAHMNSADLRDADLQDADLQGASLERVNLVRTNLARANITGCHVYGISAWDVELTDSTQSNLIITPGGPPGITVDNLEVAQFIYLLLNNQKIRRVIETITSKVVLILGRFTEERKRVLDAIREELRKHDYIPVLFDFDKPVSKDITGTVETLARMARFIIADLTDPSSIPHELATIVPFLRTTPVLPITVVGSKGYSLFEDLRRSYNWVLEIHEYADGNSLISTLPEVIAPADRMAEEFRKAR